ncbi:hypothetical protein ACTBUP_003506 [Escherichia coli]|uniref:hypothetical protein n=1 Tax=Cronobacter muytjensii TaxID=413501 RepID=UPI0015880531|nr:hypothetical protein [Cronobacter muytjensii]EFG2528765.1 hypothetical protein [Escherichia coli]NUW61637.1 hypothetical protein [Cronobacter muytjensii]
MNDNIFNPLVFRTDSDWVDFITDLLIDMADIEVDDAKKEALRNIIANLPEGSTMAGLITAIKNYEANQLGISPDAYDALTPVLGSLSHEIDIVRRQGARKHEN